MNAFNLKTRFCAAALLGALLCFTYASVASAHAHLISAQPADGVVVTTAPNEIRLTFSEGLSKLSAATIAAANKADNSVSTSALAMENDKVLVVHFNRPLGPGQYTVSWRALANDGHTTHGSYAFTIKP